MGMRYLSPLVKQDLAKLDKDGESRRIALTSLKQYVEQLDAGSMARFLTQVRKSPFAMDNFHECSLALWSYVQYNYFKNIVVCWFFVHGYVLLHLSNIKSCDPKNC